MLSPFPGMDPYLEAHWGDVHTRIVMYACEQLTGQVPRDLRVRLEEYVAVAVEDDDESEFGYYPDLHVVQREIPSTQVRMGGATTIATPHRVRRTLERPTQREIQITDRTAGNRVITAIELLSPTNKRGGRRSYRRKQRHLLASSTNLVELDFLREGAWVVAASLDAVPNRCVGPYRVCITVAEDPDECQMFEASYRFRLPVVPIPLRLHDPLVTLDLQSLVDRAYETGQYDADIDYRQEPKPALPPAEAQWADELLRKAGRR